MPKPVSESRPGLPLRGLPPPLPSPLSLSRRALSTAVPPLAVATLVFGGLNGSGRGTEVRCALTAVPAARSEGIEDFGAAVGTEAEVGAGSGVGGGRDRSLSAVVVDGGGDVTTSPNPTTEPFASLMPPPLLPAEEERAISTPPLPSWGCFCRRLLLKVATVIEEEEALES